jgi:hypothetical protein
MIGTHDIEISYRFGLHQLFEEALEGGLLKSSVEVE